jgi:hypothetical protein
MGWSWQEYRAQPQWFIMNLFEMLQNETKEMKRKATA